MSRWTGRALLGLALATGLPVAAQERVVVEEMPPDVAREIGDFFNGPGTIRFDGRARVPEGRVIVGDVAVLGGPFTVSGEVEGRVVVLNGDFEIAGEGTVDGDVTVVGGRSRISEAGRVTGTVRIYDRRARVESRDGRIRIEPPPDRRERYRDRHDRGIFLGDSRLTVRAGASYNRVEGLPVEFGPVFESGGRHPFVVEALGIWRTESGFGLDDDELGWLATAEQRIGRTRRGDPVLRLGGRFQSTVEPITDWGLRDLEASLATFLFHRDFRDYFERTGWSAYASLRIPGTALGLGVEYRDEEHEFAPVRSPWTLQDNDEPWRPQPLVAQGDLQTLEASVELDDRNSVEDPTDGWWIRVSALRGLSGDLILPRRRPLGGTRNFLPERPVDAQFAAGFLDARRYLRLGPDSDLGLRVVYGGSLDGDPVPAQFQQALGGEGSLPGYRLFSIDCGARSIPLSVERSADGEVVEETVFGSFGCDRAVLFQAEYRGHLFFDVDLGGDDDWGDEWDWSPRLEFSPSWAVFFDWGRGWSRSDPTLDTETFSDVGAGIFFGDLGLYWAFPLDGDDRDVNFFVRLQRRF